MLTFGLVNSKVCITYSRCPCNKLWRRLECPSTKQLLNNFWGDFSEKLKQFSGLLSKMDCLLKKVYRQATRPVNQICKENGCIAFNS